MEKFNDDQFVLIHKAAKEGLIEYDIDFAAHEIQRIYESYYLSDNTSAIATAWNDQRRQILKLAFEDNLLPMTKQWLLDRLLDDALNYVISRCQNRFHQTLKIAPFRCAVRERDEDHDEDIAQERVPYVFAISCGAGEISDATFGAVLNPKGECIDHIQLHDLHGRNRENRDGDVDKLYGFLKKYPIDLIAVGGWSINARQLLTELPRLTERLEMPSYGDETENPWADKKVPIIVAQDETARLFKTSKRSEKEFPSFHPTLRYCIGLGRATQEPLFEYGALFNAEEEILYLPLHPLQALVPSERLYRSLERVIINIVNDVGFDINRALVNPLAENNIQFVCGLGPRKGFALLQHFRTKVGSLRSRNELVTVAGLGASVFMNCSSFIRITKSPLMSQRNNRLDPLDDTRIHPEDYALARKMAADALEIEDVGEGDDLEFPSEHVEELMDDVGKLDELDLEDFAKLLEQQKGEPKLLALRMIAQELKEPYKDQRETFRPPSVDDVFTMFTSETDQTLKPGMFLAACVARVKDRLVIVTLESGLEGLIGLKNLTDEMVDSAETVCKPGEILKCRVQSINKERFSVELSCKQSDYRESSSRQRDPFFDAELERKDMPNGPGMLFIFSVVFIRRTT